MCVFTCADVYAVVLCFFIPQLFLLEGLVFVRCITVCVCIVLLSEDSCAHGLLSLV